MVEKQQFLHRCHKNRMDDCGEHRVESTFLLSLSLSGLEEEKDYPQNILLII